MSSDALILGFILKVGMYNRLIDEQLLTFDKSAGTHQLICIIQSAAEYIRRYKSVKWVNYFQLIQETLTDV
jgi:hypothetical protein